MLQHRYWEVRQIQRRNQLRGGVEQSKRKQAKATPSNATPSNAEAEDEDGYTDEVDLIDDREEKSSLATSSDEEENGIKLATDSNADEIELATDSNATLVSGLEVQLTFNANGGEFANGEDSITEEFILPGEVCLPKVIAPEGMSMVGWYTKPEGGRLVVEGNEEQYDFSEKDLQDVTTLFAQFDGRQELPDYVYIFLDTSNCTYTGKPVEPAIEEVWFWNGGTREYLHQDEDFEVSYKNNYNKGYGTVVLTGINKYKGSAEQTFWIGSADIKQAEITFSDESNGVYVYTGEEVKPNIKVRYNDLVLKEGIDYKFVKLEKYVGTYEIAIEGIGNFNSQKRFSIEIVAGEVFKEHKATLNYADNLYMHPGDVVNLVDVEQKELVDKIALRWPNDNCILDEDGNLHALNEISTPVIRPVVYWKDGTTTELAYVYLRIVPSTDKIVTIKAILEDGSFEDGRTEKLYTTLANNTVYFSQLTAPEGKTFKGWYTENGTKVSSTNYFQNVDQDITLYGKWGDKITIHFEFGEDATVKNDVYKTSEIVAGESVWLLTGGRNYAYERAGYLLIGWCTTPDCQGEVLTGYYTPKLTDGEHEITLYAKWVRSFNITFHAEDGYFVSGNTKQVSGSVQEQKSIGNTMPTNPVCANATFGGWFTRDGVRVTKSYIPTEDMDVYAKWLKSNTHKVTFHANGDYFYNEEVDDNDSSIATRQVEDGYPASINVSRTGYECLWYKDKDFSIPYNMNAAVTEDLDLYARWVRRLQLTWDADGGKNSSGNSSGTYSFYEGQAYSLPTVSMDGYRFMGWFTEDGKEITKQTHLIENIHIKARWEKAQIQVKLNLDGGELQEYYRKTDLYLNRGDKLSYVPAPRKEGAAFLGWQTPDGEIYSSLYNLIVTDDMEIKAIWTENYVTVTFDLEDGWAYDRFTKEYKNKISMRVPKGSTFPKALSEPDVNELADQTIKGWNLVPNSTEKIDLEKTVFTEDTILYPVWSAYWTMSFDYMGGFYGSNTPNQSSWIIPRGEAITYPQGKYMKRDGYVFDGWYENVDYQGTRYDMPFTPECDMMLYAKWRNENAAVHTVTFKTLNGEDICFEVSDGDHVGRPIDPVNAGKVFAGWYLDQEYTKKYDFGAAVYGDLTLYAKWTETKDVKDAAITFVRAVYNGKKQEPEVTVKMGSKVLEEGTDYTITYPDVPENTNAGTGYAIIEGINDFEGTVTVEFTIEKAQYDVEPRVSSVTAVYGQKLADVDLSEAGEGWSWVDDQQSVGTVGEHTFKIIYKAKDNNHEDKEATMLVVVAGVTMTSENTTLSLADDEKIYYDGTEQKPQIKVVLDGKTLTEGEDYTIQYWNNIDAGTASYVVTGINNYSGTVRGSFEILKASASAADFGIANQIYEGIYDGKLSEVSPALPEHWSWADPDTIFDTVTGDATITFPANFTTYEGCNFASAENVPLKVRIAPREIRDYEVEVDQGMVYYTGSECTVPIRVITKGRLLTENVDYTVSYRNNIEVGTASVIVTGIGHYTGTAVGTFQIITDPYDIRGAEIRVNPIVSAYTGEEITPEVTVLLQNAETGKTDTLRQGIDYTVSYANNVNPGTAAVTVTGIGKYHDAKTAKFFIEADEYIITATYGDKLADVADQLPEGWSWKDADAYVGNVTGREGRSVEAVYTADGEERSGSFLLVVEAKELRGEMIQINGENISYHPNVEENKAEVVVTDPDLQKVLVENVDYAVEYSGYENVSADGVTVTVTGIGNYKGSFSNKYTLAKADPKVELKSDKIEQNVMKLTALDESFFLYTTFAGNGTVTYTSSDPSVFTVETRDNQIGNANDGYITVTGIGEAELTMKLSGDPNYEDQELVIRVEVSAVTLQDSDVSLEKDSYAYTGAAIEPEVTVSYNGKTLTEGNDYAVAYANNTNAGEASVTVTGTGSFRGTVVKTFTIEKAENPVQAPTEVFEAVYGQTLGSISLPNGWTWDAADEYVGTVGTHRYAITLAETDNYVEKHAEAEVVVSAKALTEDMIQLSAETFEYTGTAIEPEVTVSDGTLLSAEDYTVVYENNVEVGTNATVTVTAVEGGNYTGSITKTFTITRAAVTEEAVHITGSYTYDGTQQKPEVTVTISGRELSAGVDYEIAYGENIHAGIGAGSVTVSGIGNYTGEITVTFDIEKAENPAEAPELAFTVVYGQKLETLELPEGWFWRDSSAAVGDAGEHSVEIYLPETGDYKEKISYVKVTVESKQTQKDMLKADFSGITFSGTEAKPEITLTDGDYVLKEGIDYTVSYKNNLHAGTATMTITFMGNYSGTIEQEFTIEQAEAEITVGAGLNITHKLQGGAFALEAAVSGNGELQYTSTNPAVATVDEDGIVTPVGAGTTVITVIFMGDNDYKPAAVSVELTITKTSGGSSGGHSGSGSSGGSGAGSSAGQNMTYNGVTIPSYVNVMNKWQLLENGNWTLVDVSGDAVRDQWMAVYNPYADTAHGQQAYDWYRFDGSGNMMTGWYTDEKGDTYYLNPSSDNTKGGMKTGWVEIDGKWYYFNTQSDGTRGRLLKNTTTPDGYHVQEDGSWDGVQKK